MHTTSAERVIGFALPSVYCQYAMYDLHSVFHKNRKPVDEIKIQAVEGIPSILTMTICMLNYYYACCYVCSLRESLTVVDRGFSYM